MENYCVRGQKPRFFSVVDTFTREALASEVARSFPTKHVAAVLSRLPESHNAPRYIRSDNGLELVPKAMAR